jgi:formamidopyrimidine-DNA glycosylase
MPELPEAETIVRDLRGRIPGAVVTRVSVVKPDVLHTGLTASALGPRLRGRRIDDVTRRGKNVVLVFEGGLPAGHQPGHDRPRGHERCRPRR